jgi:hypothetical protein
VPHQIKKTFKIICNNKQKKEKTKNLKSPINKLKNKKLIIKKFGRLVRGG